MPRTKRVRKTAHSADENIKPNKIKVVRSMISDYLKALDKEVAMRKVTIDGLCNRLTLGVTSMVKECQLKFHPYASKTMAELKILKPTTHSTFCEVSSVRNITVNATKSSNKSKNQSSIESTSTLRSTTRSNIKKAKATRASRSLSRTKIQMAISANSYATPLNNSVGTFGLVTPKVKPNTPQVVLRRPKQGEIAISMQGSPLMVNSVMSDQKANVNIPLLDGRVLSIQPQRGLRTSQIPELDAETRRQIETLRDNLNKVCALTARR